LIVVDASAFLDVLLRTPAAAAIERHLFADGQTLHAPHLVDLEIAQVLRRYSLNREISAARGVEALQDFAAFPIERYSHLPFLPRVWELRASLTAYDAAYVALAEVLDAPVLTSDARLGRTRGHRARIITPKLQ
jgi:predicted nucleic acid-binding protein